MQNPEVLSQHARKVEPVSPDPLLPSGWFEGVACETMEVPGFIIRPVGNLKQGYHFSGSRDLNGLKQGGLMSEPIPEMGVVNIIPTQPP